ncbi:MAG: hypothetical protein Q9227_001136 [Pyrenula ochraceoflavens]
MSAPIGITVPKMLPITGTWTLPFTAYLFLLSGRVVSHRLSDEKYLGDDAGKGSEDDFDALQVATRAHQNFLENIPLALIISAVAELNGGNRKVLNSALGALLALRIMHCEFGLRGKGAMSVGRPLGYYGTMGFLGGMSAYAAFLIKGRDIDTQIPVSIVFNDEINYLALLRELLREASLQM